MPLETGLTLIAPMADPLDLKDWASTALGPCDRWPVALCAVTRLCLAADVAMVVFWGPEARLIYNTRYGELIGSERSRRSLGLPAAQAFPEFWPSIADLIDRVKSDGDCVTVTDLPLEVARDAQSGLRYFSFSCSPIHLGADTIGGVFAVVQETTGRVETEREAALLRQRMQEVFSQAPVGIAVTAGPTHIFEYVNPAYCRVFPGRDFLGKTLRQNFSEYTAEIFAAYDACYQTSEARTFHSLRADTISEDQRLEERYFDVVFQPLRNEHGQTDRIVIIGYDVTGLTLARREAEHANTEKDRFIAMLGHELRNPLAPISTTIQLLEMRGAAAQYPKEIGILGRQVQHVVRLVDDLLDIARITRGAIELKRSRIELAEAVDKAVETSLPLIEQRRHGLQIEVSREGLPVYADLGRLTQIIANLLNNAAKYTPPGGRLRIRATRARERAELHVEDDGMGMTLGEIERVFDLFVQGDQGLDRSAGGLGLGLAIARSLTQLHDGALHARSEGRGQGSCFTLTLPLATLAAAEGPAPSADDLPLPCGENRAVLVVDDNRDAAESLSALLQAWGYVTTTRFDARSALATLRQQSFCLALLDIGLPVMDGYQLAAAIRSDDALASLPLVAVTGYGQQGDIERAQAAGFDLHLTKPLAQAQLTALFRKLDLSG